MTIHSTVSVKQDTICYVDAAWGGAETGASDTPFATIAAAIAASAAGDVIMIAPGTYTEDLAFAAGEDMTLTSEVPGSVSVVGSMVTTDASVRLEGVELVDDGAGVPLHFTGTGADTLTLDGCRVEASATGDHAFEMDNTAGTVVAVGSYFGADVANANEVMKVESGDLDLDGCNVIHGSNVAEAIVSEGDAASNLIVQNCSIVGSVNGEAAVAAATTHTYRDCDFTVGAISAGIVAATCTINLEGTNTVTSADAGNDAFDGAGSVVVGGDVVFLSTADEFAGTLTVTRLPTDNEQTGVVAAAGASPQTDAVTLPQPYADTNYSVQLTFEATGGGADDVVCSVDEGTIATTGFTVVTTSIAAAAVSGNVHWKTTRSA